jgi:MSHA biogenesis protein MshP
MSPIVARVQGFAIVSAIFILVVLAALGAFVLNISTNQQIGSLLDVQGVRAYQAAKAGVEWGLYKVQSTPAYNFGYTSTNPNNRACPAATTSFTPGAATLAGFVVTVTCTATTDGSGGPTIYAIVSTACNQAVGGACPNVVSPGALYVERRLEVAL